MIREPFFPIAWKALTTPQFMPAAASVVTDPIFSIAWQPTLGWAHYPHEPLNTALRVNEGPAENEGEKKRRSD